MSADRRYFATAPRGTASLLAEELRALDAVRVAETSAGVDFYGDLAAGYRACLWSRTASRILLPLGTFHADTPDALYRGVREIDWGAHLSADATLAVDLNSRASAITHTHYGALKVKDAICDQLRENCGRRPSVALERPDLRVNVHLHRDQATVSIDLSGESLHRRGYRTEGVSAPLKENLAAALLLRAGWPGIAGQGGALVDPMCGSGTLPIEAALMAGNVAPGLNRAYFGFLGWRQHDAALWDRLLAEARGQRRVEALPPIVGYDNDAGAVRSAINNLERAGLRGVLHIERRELGELRPPPGAAAGLVMVNPPYGERMGEKEQLGPLYSLLGERLRQHFLGWQAAVLTGNPELGKHLGMRAYRTHNFFNGAIPCRLLRFRVEPGSFYREHINAPPVSARSAAPAVASAGTKMFANRLRKNLRTLGRWARREGIDCYRLYDADMPEYALAVDLYAGEKLWINVQEYAPPSSVEPQKAEERLREALAAIPEVLGIPAQQLFLRIRKRQRGPSQYGRLAAEARFHEVRENGCRFLVNFTDYLDTGLFLDHRLTRALIGGRAKGTRFLNLFGYTGTATVYAALGGAASSTTVDLSPTYLEWASRNMALNGVDSSAHSLVQSDCRKWLEQHAERRDVRFGLIFMDPPTFSNSKRMQGVLDVQRDHANLIRHATALLEAGGELIFSTNFRRFKLDEAALAGLSIEDISARTIPHDFARNPKVHQCWRFRVNAGHAIPDNGSAGGARAGRRRSAVHPTIDQSEH